MPSSIFTKEFHLKADNEQESAQIGFSSFIDISRSSVQVLKRSKAFKAIEFVSFRLPYTASDSIWVEHISELLRSEDFKSATANSDLAYSIFDSNVTLVPASLYTEAENSRSFEFLFGDSGLSKLLKYDFSEADMVGIYEVPENIAELQKTPIRSS